MNGVAMGLFAALGAAIELPLFAQPVLTVVHDRADAVYGVGETVTFTIAAKDEKGELLHAGGYSVTLDNFGPQVVLQETELDFADGNPRKVSGVLKEPGFLRLRLHMPGVTNIVTSVAISPSRIRPGAPCPKDFDAFWQKAVSEYDRAVPPDVALSPLPMLSTEHFDAFEISLSTPTHRRIYGVLSRPKDLHKGPFPLWCGGKGAGPASMDRCGRDGRVVLEMNVHYYKAPPGRGKSENGYRGDVEPDP